MTSRPFVLVAAVTGLSTAPAVAQSNVKAAPSTRATIEVAFSPPRVQGQPAPTPLKVRVDYGQPHARGRKVDGALEADLGTAITPKVWRLGANDATTLTTDLDLVIGGVAVPKGAYSLYALTASDGNWKLIISTHTGETATEYKEDKDLARVALTSKVLPVSVESFTIAMVPAADGTKGELRFMWGTREFTTTWAVK